MRRLVAGCVEDDEMDLCAASGLRWRTATVSVQTSRPYQQPTQSADLMETHLRCVILEVAARDFGGGCAAHGETRGGGAGGRGRRGWDPGAGLTGLVAGCVGGGQRRWVLRGPRQRAAALGVA